MRLQLAVGCIVGVLAGGSSASLADLKLENIDRLPDGLSKAVAGAIDPHGYRLGGADGVVAEFWLAKDVALQPGFSPTLNISYPFAPGSLVGVLRVPDGKTFKDYRGQELSGGVYTLRYGRQPEDGNHVGTSETYDFLLAVSARQDQDPAVAKDFMTVVGQSARTVGSNHPAIFSLLPAEKAPKAAELVHDANRDFWILHTVTAGKDPANGKAAQVPVRLVVIGKAEA